ncbi:MAG: NADH-quinone oxidoreductase subunit NuoK [bacterium]
MGLTGCLVLSALLFAIGVSGVLLRRNAVVIIMSVELMLNAANLALVSFSRYLPGHDGQVLAFIVIAVAAAEAAVGLALVVQVARSRGTVDVDDLTLLRG